MDTVLLMHGLAKYFRCDLGAPLVEDNNLLRLLWVIVRYKLWRLVVSVRTYSNKHNRKQFAELVRLMEGMKTLTFRFGATISDSATVPSLLVSLSRAVVITSENVMANLYSETQVTTKLHVWRLRCQPPLIEDRSCLDRDNVATIKVLRGKRDVVLTHETAVKRCVPPGPLANAQSAATKMATMYRESGGEAKVFILHGTPGSGKSITTRVLTQQLNGVLYPDYNSTYKYDNLILMIEEHASEESPLIVAFEEFDVALTNVMYGHGLDDNCDTTDKSSWNKLLDAVQLQRHCIVVMTTNRTTDELLYGCGRSDKSLLRKGRVDGTIAFEAEYASTAQILNLNECRTPPLSPKSSCDDSAMCADDDDVP